VLISLYAVLIRRLSYQEVPACHTVRISVCFIILTYLVPVLFTFYIQGVLKLKKKSVVKKVNPLTPNDHYRCRTAPLTSKRCILYMYSTNIGTECFEHGIYSPFFPLQSAVCFITLTYLVPVFFTFYIQDVLKFNKNSVAKKVNPLTPNDHYRSRTAPLTCKRCILYMYSTNIGTEYFEHGIILSVFFLFKMEFFS